MTVERFDSIMNLPLGSSAYLGVAGDPLPYTLQSDDAIVSIVLGCLLMTLLVYSLSSETIHQQFKLFFQLTRNTSNNITPGTRILLLLCLQTGLLVGFLTYLFNAQQSNCYFIVDEPYQLSGIFAAVYAGFFIVRILLYTIVNVVFFPGKKRRHWLWNITFITALEGVALIPVIVLHVFSVLSLESVAYYLIFILILAKILTIYKCWRIFFWQNSLSLQIILYLCALEIIPLLGLAGALMVLTNELKVIY